MPCEFARSLHWRQGPSWLSEPEDNWPSTPEFIKEIPELKKEICLTMSSIDIAFYYRFSSYEKTIRVLAYCLRFCKRSKVRGPLNIEEIDQAEMHIIKFLQATHYKDIIVSLGKSSNVDSKKFARLSPFLDEHGILRVGGRLHKSNLSYAQKHSNYIAESSFDRLLDTRDSSETLARRYSNHAASTKSTKMGNLPAQRISSSVPFTHTGTDFCGPFFIKDRKFRNRIKIKVYVCVYICMSIKAVHLELVSDMSTEGFLASFRRFLSRRGLPQHVYWDNGTNFVGARNQLKEIYEILNTDSSIKEIGSFAIKNRIVWHFIPPATPHFGGLWESTVKIFKHHLYRVIGESLFTFEELNTLMTEIEGVINSRPIASVSCDPNDLQALPPGHYLIGRPLTSLPERQFSSTPCNRLSTWQHITKMRSKWTKNTPNIQLNALVLIKNKGLPCSQWALGRVKEIHTGDDGIVRAVTLHTATGDLRRGTNYLCPVPEEKIVQLI
ncbi:uncharacterized protein [Prorops nasuta]|uniref:uncharacterized protein n=1 Tax=Prorops nasuta TaxID=863751 RepID=UPI0034CF2ED9